MSGCGSVVLRFCRVQRFRPALTAACPCASMLPIGGEESHLHWTLGRSISQSSPIYPPALALPRPRTHLLSVISNEGMHMHRPSSINPPLRPFVFQSPVPELHLHVPAPICACDVDGHPLDRSCWRHAAADQAALLGQDAFTLLLLVSCRVAPHLAVAFFLGDRQLLLAFSQPPLPPYRYRARGARQARADETPKETLRGNGGRPEIRSSPSVGPEHLSIRIQPSSF